MQLGMEAGQVRFECELGGRRQIHMRCAPE